MVTSARRKVKTFLRRPRFVDYLYNKRQFKIYLFPIEQI